jgi:hypothetical protein
MALQQPSEQEGPALVARGTKINLGGSMVEVRFDNRALVELERRWGSLSAYTDELNKGHQGKMFTCITDAIAATVRGLPKGIDPIDLIDVTRSREYLDAIAEAFMEAMPSAQSDQASQEVAGPLVGVASSMSESSDSGWRPPTSGE